ncbi:MAG: hypothetical protein IPM24_15840 [Bryobacterales bacterium]|nr:hypothetical protein [Bryobacterales bacterium]
MDVTDVAVGKPVQHLRAAEYGQIQFVNLAPNSRVLGGSVKMTVNSAILLDFVVPPQRMNGDKLFIRNIAKVLTSLASEGPG